jgi:hypothetical protein
MRQRSGTFFTVPSAKVTSASIFWRGLTVSRPRMVTVSSPFRPSEAQVVPSSKT